MADKKKTLYNSWIIGSIASVTTVICGGFFFYYVSQVNFTYQTTVTAYHKC